MSIVGRSLFEVEDLDNPGIESLFHLVSQLKERNFTSSEGESFFKASSSKPLIGLVFLEPSTRTRVSFEVAAKRLGFETTTLDSVGSSSLSKGESLVDTIETVAAMRPDLLVVRYSGEAEVSECLRALPMPVVNAGSGSMAHPTQALLDAFSIQERLGRVEGQKVVFVGDVFHSRVANSNIKLLTRLGAEVAVCAPPSMIPRHGQWANVQNFSELKEALPWCDVCVGLRIQAERHQAEDFGFSLEDYITRYRIDKEKLKFLAKDSIVMHPGPFKPDVDFTVEVLEDPRSIVREQVTNGVFIRAALMAQIFGLEVRA